MSVHHLRKDKTCLNCGQEVRERYCTHCGQENTEPHETFGHLVSHFFQDVTHYDSKAWITIRDLMLKPGLLTKLYMAGKRQSFVNPIRMYIFTSFVFFLVLAYIGPHYDPYEMRLPGEDTVRVAYEQSLVTIDERAKDSTVSLKGGSSVTSFSVDTTFTGILRGTIGNPKEAVRRYDSLQATKPLSKRDGTAGRFFARSTLYMNGKYGSNAPRVMLDKLQHNIPKLMFILLPLFALFMSWMYRGKKWFFADHAIFTIHLHTFLFLLGILAFLFDHLFHTNWFSFFAWIISILYFVLALKKVYGQSTGKTILKAFLIFVTYSFSILLIIVLYVLSILALL
ncbi:DUF3667 domain-containing protein [uncultured Chitinophaga sp.]|uniref:DUF3667 domain-containing protein n=1 Tax=uncultured Chitinophaga sp. TaxID=339340 RepID=UPI0025DD5C42|nr:DUF3667 domain-containing protein [uncultured Chitinophaga sp.]